MYNCLIKGKTPWKKTRLNPDPPPSHDIGSIISMWHFLWTYLETFIHSFTLQNFLQSFLFLLSFQESVLSYPIGLLGPKRQSGLNGRPKAPLAIARQAGDSHYCFKRFKANISRINQIKLLLNKCWLLICVTSINLRLLFVIFAQLSCLRSNLLLSSHLFVGTLPNIWLVLSLNLPKKNNVEVEDCKGQSYHNISNVSGHYFGLKARFVIPSYFVGLIAAKSCRACVIFFGIIKRLYNFFCCLSLSTGTADQSPATKHLVVVKRLINTRWSAYKDAPHVMSKGSPEKMALEDIANDPREEKNTVDEANGLKNKIKSLKFVLLSRQWNTILTKLNCVRKSVQAADANLSTVTLDVFCAIVTRKRDISPNAFFTDKQRHTTICITRRSRK